MGAAVWPAPLEESGLKSHDYETKNSRARTQNLRLLFAAVTEYKPNSSGHTKCDLKHNLSFLKRPVGLFNLDVWGSGF